VFLFSERQQPFQRCLMWKSNVPNPVTIKTPPNKHENPFVKKADGLWLGYELDYDEYWETGRMTLDIVQSIVESHSDNLGIT
jgi:hypothetical protein